MKNSEQFLDYFNKIDKFIKETEAFDSSIGFTVKVKKSINKVVKRFKEELISLAELRNAIVHNPRIDNEYIAEPHTKTVERIIFLHKEITNPEKVIPAFQFKVLGAIQEEYLNDILITMKQSSFSQFPVFDDDNQVVVELINTNTISRWVSGRLEENGTIMIEQVKVKDLIPEIEFKKNYKFISRNTSVYEAHEMFLDQINRKGRNLDVLFITNSGKPTEKLLGLITIEDIATKVQFVRHIGER